MADCEFCKIVSGDAPSSVVYQDNHTLAMMTLRPMARGHILVIPKKHATSLSEMGYETGGELFKLGMKITEALRASEIESEGVNFWLADGKAAGQEVFHVHLHVLPRSETDEIRLEGPRLDLNRPEMDSDAKIIKQQLNEHEF
ncbi:HIT domain-containing protein [Halorubrum ezzemoulense]|uniref:HIT family protein n=1 Tax=Halorubrum ezzemoulense TaxID=337243 RepID=UPI00232F14BD|nr:HIT domain-containing protein [Halorubrum ezzemoulense]MDB2284508.1 HIT domain-containing protein [Halorubrum ezzemoulense]